MRNVILTILFAITCSAIFGQDNRFGFGIEYSPNFNNTSGPDYFFNAGEQEYRLAQNAFVLGQYRLFGNLYVTAGFGYLETREFQAYDLPGAPYDIYKVESHLFHHYVVAPVGLDFKFGPFYLRPEIGIGWNVSNTSLDTYYFGSPNSGSSMTMKNKDEHNINGINSMTYPLFFSFGHEAKLKSCTLILGVKSYYSLNPTGRMLYGEFGHYYGFGVSLGVRM